MIMNNFPYLNDYTFLKDFNKIRNKEQYTKIIILDKYENPEKEIQGKILSGSSLNVDGKSAMRRTCSINILINDIQQNLIDYENLFTKNKRIVISIGFKNTTKQYKQYPILWFPQGIFVINSQNISYGLDGIKISLSLHDKMALLNGENGGIIPNTLILHQKEDQDQYGDSIITKTKIKEIIKQVVHHWGKQQLNKIIIKDLEDKVKKVVRWVGENDSKLYIYDNREKDTQSKNIKVQACMNKIDFQIRFLKEAYNQIIKPIISKEQLLKNITEKAWINAIFSVFKSATPDDLEFLQKNVQKINDYTEKIKVLQKTSQEITNELKNQFQNILEFYKQQNFIIGEQNQYYENKNNNQKSLKMTYLFDVRYNEIENDFSSFKKYLTIKDNNQLKEILIQKDKILKNPNIWDNINNRTLKWIELNSFVCNIQIICLQICKQILITFQDIYEEFQNKIYNNRIFIMNRLKNSSGAIFSAFVNNSSSNLKSLDKNLFNYKEETKNFISRKDRLKEILKTKERIDSQPVYSSFLKEAAQSKGMRTTDIYYYSIWERIFEVGKIFPDVQKILETSFSYITNIFIDSDQYYKIDKNDSKIKYTLSDEQFKAEIDTKINKLKDKIDKRKIVFNKNFSLGIKEINNAINKLKKKKEILKNTLSPFCETIENYNAIILLTWEKLNIMICQNYYKFQSLSGLKDYKDRKQSIQEKNLQNLNTINEILKNYKEIIKNININSQNFDFSFQSVKLEELQKNYIQQTEQINSIKTELSFSELFGDKTSSEINKLKNYSFKNGYKELRKILSDNNINIENLSEIKNDIINKKSLIQQIQKDVKERIKQILEVSNITNINNLKKFLKTAAEKQTYSDNIMDSLIYNLLNQTTIKEMLNKIKEKYIEQNNYIFEYSYGEDIGFTFEDFYYPKDFIVNAGTTVTSILDQIKNLLGNYEYFYDINGNFVFQEIKNYLNNSYSTSILSQITNNDYIINYKTEKQTYNFTESQIVSSYTIAPQYNNIKNDFLVWGERKTIDGKKIPIRYHLAIDIKDYSSIDFIYDYPIGDSPLRYDFKTSFPKIGESNKIYFAKKENNFYEWDINKQKYRLISGISNFNSNKCIICSQIKTLPENPLEDKIYYTIKENCFFKWNGQKYVLYPSYFLKTINNNNKDLYSNAYYKIYKSNDFRTNLYLQGKNTLMTGLETNDYYAELSNEWPKLFDLTSGKFYSEVEKNPSQIDYFLDFIDNAELNQKWGIKTIGRRTHIIQNNSINCIFEPDCPKIFFIDSSLSKEEKETLKNEIQIWNLRNLGNHIAIEIPKEIYKQISIGGFLRSAFEEIRSELYLYTTYNEKLSLNTIPIYHLQPNTMIYIKQDKININDNYIIQNYSIPLDGQGTMNISCSKALTRI